MIEYGIVEQPVDSSAFNIFFINLKHKTVMLKYKLNAALLQYNNLTMSAVVKKLMCYHSDKLIIKR